jgi:hypothetical protein
MDTPISLHPAPPVTGSGRLPRPVGGALLAAVALMASPVWASPDPAAIAGVYKHLQKPTVEDGARTQSEDILEIVPYGPEKEHKAYFRLQMRFAKFHTCDATGIARTTPDGLDFEGEVFGNACKLKIAFTPRGLRIRDEEDRCRMAFCGARGTLNWTSPILKSDRRPIRYMQRLLDSDEYKQAVALDKKAAAPKPSPVP